ncbi:MAG: Ku protein [Hyphomicrobiaceae bacterium]|nr:Ku protein [Hyphomicrobiaceae bacterium]
MAQRPIWRGHFRLALVSCPVALYSAHRDRGTLRFNLINPATGHRIRMLTVDAETNEEVARRDLVKGYEFKKNHYLLLSDEEIDSVRVPSSTTMTVEKFVPADTLDPIYFDASYYLAPDGDAGEDVFAVLRDAIAASGTVALTHVVIARRERIVAIMPMGDGLVAHTLHEERDLNSAGDVFDPIAKMKSDPEMVQLARQLIDRQTGVYDPKDVEDRYEARLRALIEAKLKGEGLAEDEVEPDRGNVIDLMAALKQSLGQSPDETAPKAAKRSRGKPKAAAAAKTQSAKPVKRAPGRRRA